VSSPDPFAFMDVMLRPNDIPKQLRMVLFEKDECTLFAGHYRSERETSFSDEDHALLFAARPTLRAWDRISRAVGDAPLGDGYLVATLTALSQPALLLHRQRVVYANANARPLIAAVRSWVGAGRPAGFAHVAPLSPRGLDLELVLPLAEAPPLALPPSLRRIADLLGSGMSDKEIAVALDVPLATVRTYAARIYARLKVEGRRDLMRARGRFGA